MLLWRRASPGALGRTGGIRAQGWCQGARQQSTSNVVEYRDRTCMLRSYFEAARKHDSAPAGGAPRGQERVPAAVSAVLLRPRRGRPRRGRPRCRSPGAGLLPPSSSVPPGEGSAAPSPRTCLPFVGCAPAQPLSETVPILPRPRETRGEPGFRGKPKRVSSPSTSVVL